MANARQKILNFILEEQSTTVDELSKVFKVTPANIRHHLSILMEQGSLKIIGQTETTGKGRPAAIYSTAQQSDQNNLDQLSDTLLSTLLARVQADETHALLHHIAKQMVSKCIVDSYNPTRRLYSCIRALNRMNYLAHWEAHIENPRIMLGHCPYLAILEQHPEICQMDVFLLQELLDARVRQTDKLTLNTKRLPQCVFLINQAPA